MYISLTSSTVLHSIKLKISLIYCNTTISKLAIRGLITITRDVPDIRFRLAGYPAIFSNPVPAKTVPGTGYLSRIVLGHFWQLVELSLVHPAPMLE